MLVWKAMLSITLVMSEILRELALMASMVCTTWVTTSPPFCRRGGCFGRQAVGLMGGLRTLRHGARQIAQRAWGACRL